MHCKLIYCLTFFFIFCLFSCSEQKPPTPTKVDDIESVDIKLTLDEASRLSKLPLACIQNPLPYKAGHTIAKPSDLSMPQEHHPAFYGCFDWHSAVHGHWSLVYLLKEFSALKDARVMLEENITAENIKTEIDYFSLNRYTKSFERTYGWAWLLKLQEELCSWDDPQAQNWYNNIDPLAKYISQAYIEYLPKLVYPIRVGEHSNTAFGLSFAYDYALTIGDSELKNAIETAAIRFYKDDQNCPISWEPSGYDFLSPCLQELDIMRKVLSPIEFKDWSKGFLPDLYSGELNLEPGKILDRSDGKLVHLDGLNFSRAWCLYPLQNNKTARQIADEHMAYSLSKITDGDYAGQHWLASFALYAFKTQSTPKYRR